MRFKSLVVVAVTVAISAVFASATPGTTQKEKNLLITTVDTDFVNSQLQIFGTNLCTNPQVFLSGQELNVASAGPPIVADVAIAVGDFLLVVSCDKQGSTDTKKKDVDGWNLTVGAAGPQGPVGPEGPPGPDPAPLVFYTVVVENQLIARCNAGDVVVGGGGACNVLATLWASTPVGSRAWGVTCRRPSGANELPANAQARCLRQ